MSKQKPTPLMQQYFDIKKQYPENILLFQVGDFYELFFDDAKTASSFLAIALTKRGKNQGKDIPLCGIPIHALNHYLHKLIKGGFKVAICDQLEKPQPGTVVKRGVTQVFTPGTLTDSLMLDDKSSSYLLSFYPGEKNWGLVFTELLTAQLFATTIPINAYRTLESELIRFFPDEIILPDIKTIGTFNTYFKKLGYCASLADNLVGDYAGQPISKAWLETQFTKNTQTYITRNQALTLSIDTLYTYLKKNQEKALIQFTSIQFYKPDDYLILDSATQKNLEIVKNSQDAGRKNTLFSVLDQAKTSMGSRTLKKWLLRPLIQKDAIVQRQTVVKMLYEHVDLCQQLEELLTQLSDIERIIGRIALKRALLPDYLALKNSLALLPGIKKLLSAYLDIALIKTIHDKLHDFSDLVLLLDKSLNDDPASKHIIKQNFDHNLDTLRNLVNNSQQEILKLEQKESASTKISSLKIRYNNISGYYIEVTNPNLKLVPDYYIHQQTLVNRKRFVTQELKTLEQDIVRAQTEIETVEKNVFDRIKQNVEDELAYLRHGAQALAYLDGLFGLARAAYDNRYVAPVFHDNTREHENARVQDNTPYHKNTPEHTSISRDIIITNGRHPVIETKCPDTFVSNNTHLTQESSLLIITGPNMGGKSTYLRQAALICLMAQCGSFVPADSAQLPILDRIFTRIGSADNLAEGKSTFLVEMEETATICTQATKNSLVILDEVGRGTSTTDGIALAHAIIEYIAIKIQAKCLFATHYHELTQLEHTLQGVKNYYLQCTKKNNILHFLHTIAPGIAQKSFGLDVAVLAQLPEAIVKRAQELLEQAPQTTVSNGHVIHSTQKKSQTQAQDYSQNNSQRVKELERKLLSYQTVFNTLKDIDQNNLSPKQAFDVLWEVLSCLGENQHQ